MLSLVDININLNLPSNYFDKGFINIFDTLSTNVWWILNIPRKWEREKIDTIKDIDTLNIFCGIDHLIMQSRMSHFTFNSSNLSVQKLSFQSFPNFQSFPATSLVPTASQTQNASWECLHSSRKICLRLWKTRWN